MGKVFTCTMGVLMVSLLASPAVGASGKSSLDPGVHTGGTLTVLVGEDFIGDWSTGLDPGGTTGANIAAGELMDAVYGELFDLGAHNKLMPDLATGYQLTNDATTLTIDLRHGVKFSDGTALDAAAVVYNFKRDLAVAMNAAVLGWPKTSSITAPNPYTVVVRFTSPDGAAVTQMLDNSVSWMMSPTALKKLGEQRFEFYPVGAGPFEVVSDTANTKLVLKKNPNYWEKGHPYLNGLTFEDASSDAVAVEDLEAHNGQAYEYLTTPQLVRTVKSAGFTVTDDPGDSPSVVLTNNGIPPFNNIKAREALYYATDSAAIDKKIFLGTCPVAESFTGPGGLFYEPKVPGYRTYDLAKAKALVKQLGGLNFTLIYAVNSAAGGENVAVALQSMYDEAGMKVKLQVAANVTALTQDLDTHKWQANTADIGSYDPAGGVGVAFRLASAGPFTGTHDPTVDHYIMLGLDTVNQKARAAAYAQLAAYVSKEAYVPFLCSEASWDIAAKGVTGPGLTTSTGGSFGEGPLVLWQDVSMGGK